MKEFSCLVKGSILQAVQAAAAHNITVLSTKDKNERECWIRVESSEHNHTQLVAWVNEKPEMIPGYGFPNGTLIHFTSVPADGTFGGREPRG